MKWWIKGGLTGVGVYLFGLALFSIQELFFSGYSIFEPIATLILFSFLRIFISDIITADLISFVVMPFVWFLIGAVIALIISKIKSK